MYEFSLTNSVNDAIQRLCMASGWSKVNRVLIRIRGMKKVNPELMAFIFAALSKNTPAEGAVLSVMLLPVTFKCDSCSRTGISEDTEISCPYCGSMNVKLLSRLELAIESIEVES